MSLPALAQGRILIVDDDGALLGLLSSLLEEVGCDVETIQGTNGLTPQLMALGRPALVLINPLLKGISRNILRGVIQEFKRTSRRPVLLLSDMSDEQLAAQALDLSADGYVPIRTVLRDPSVVAAVSRQQPAQPRSPNATGRQMRDLVPTDILDMELEHGPGSPPRQPARPSAQQPRSRTSDPQRSELAAQLLAAIEEEMSTIDVTDVEAVETYDVAVDVMSEANLYVDGLGMVSGVFIPSPMPPREGAKVEVKLTFPWGGQMAFEGVVEWTREASNFGRRTRGGFGTKFPDLAGTQQAMLQRFLKLRQPMQGR